MPESLRDHHDKVKAREQLRKYLTLCCHCNKTEKVMGYPWCEKCMRWYAILEKVRQKGRHFWWVCRVDPGH